MAKTFFENSKRNFSRQPYTSHFTDEITAEYLLVATTAVKRLLDNWAGVVLATVPVLDPAGIIGLRGNGLTPSKIDDFLSEPSL